MESKSSLNRYSPLLLNSKKTLKNRVVVPPMASETADENGLATEVTLAHYERLTQAGAGLVMVEYSYVHDSGKSEPKQLGVQSDAHLPGLQKIAEIIHRSGSLAGLQLSHAGGKTERVFTGGALMGPSAIAVPVKDQTLETPTSMTKEDIQLWKDSFLKAVSRAAKAGFDIVEFHAAHGYGINQWLSPITNQRTDGYGGSPENRARLLIEILSEAQAAEPHLIFAVRLPGQDFVEGGLSRTEMKNLAEKLAHMGLGMIDISSGIGGWRRPRDRRGEGYLVDEAEFIQTGLDVPVIGVGGIENGSFIDEAVSSKRLSLAAVGRAILKDPAAWGRENLQVG